MDLLESVDTLFEINVVRWKLSLYSVQSAVALLPRLWEPLYLIVSSTELLLDVLLSSSSERREGGSIHAVSQRDVRFPAAQGDARYVLPESLKLVHLDWL